jgi:DNA-directed RNA polymerase specialized sigma24 family protein
MAREPDWDVLHKRMKRTASRRGVPSADVDDVVQEAVFKILKRGSWTSDNVESHVFRALKDKEAEYWRRRKRTEQRIHVASGDGDQVLDPLEKWSPPHPDAALELVLTESAIREVIDDDAMAFAVLNAMGFTGKQIAGTLNWSKKKTEAARIRLARKQNAIARAILRSLPRPNDGEVRDAD